MPAPSMFVGAAPSPRLAGGRSAIRRLLRRRLRCHRGSGSGRACGRLGKGFARGFTLVELLIALVLIAIITVLMFSGLRLGSRAWEGVETAADRAADLRITHNVIERTLRQTRSVSLVVDAVQVPVFAGDAQRLELVAPLSEQVGIPGLYLLRLGLEEAGEYPRLVMARWLLHPDVLDGGDDYPAWKPLIDASTPFGDYGALDRDMAGGVYGRTLLLPEVADFELSYFGIAEGEQEPEWRPEWLEQPGLPLKVRLWVTTPRQSWPAAVVELPDGADERNRRGTTTTSGPG